jgi:hypothetical protein
VSISLLIPGAGPSPTRIANFLCCVMTALLRSRVVLRAARRFRTPQANVEFGMSLKMMLHPHRNRWPCVDS